ncbi:MAG: ABC transporter permease [Thermoleophilia bacterium]|nr:ABC transporter permease [Thermoleophilia bacterium]
MLSLRIASRFLRKSPVQSILIAAGIAVGIGVQVFLGSLIISLQQDLVDQTVGSAPQVTVQSPTDGSPVAYTADMQATIRGENGVTTQVPVWMFSAILREGAQTAPLRLMGGELTSLDTIYDLSGKVVTGTASLDGSSMLVGTDLADEYGLAPGSAVTLVLPSGETLDERVAAVVDLGSSAANLATAFVSRDAAAGVLGYSGDQVSQVQMQVADVFDSQTVADQLKAQPAFADTEVTEWQSQNKDLLDALQAQSSSSYTIQFFVLVAVALGIASTLAISAVQKTRQIGILKAMGMKDRQTGRIFLWEASILGLVGATIGVGVGVGLIALFSLQGSTFTLAPQWGFAGISWLVGVLVALASSLIPSRRTSKLDPIEVIQGG